MTKNYHIAITAAIEAGKEILKVYADDDFNVETKSDNSPLTRADKNGHLKIMEYLNTTDIPVLSEEGKHLDYSERKAWSKFWLVDPLDGTKEFIKRNGEFTVNIALIENNIPVFGVIFVPVTRELYFGINEKGAFKIDKVSEGETFSDFESLMNAAEKLLRAYPDRTYTAVGSRSHMSEETEAIFRKLETKHGKIEIISKGSSLKLCMVAEGKADIYPRLAPTMEWDTGAGDAIVRASGATVVRADTLQPLTYNKENLLNPHFIVERK